VVAVNLFTKCPASVQTFISLCAGQILPVLCNKINSTKYFNSKSEHDGNFDVIAPVVELSIEVYSDFRGERDKSSLWAFSFPFLSLHIGDSMDCAIYSRVIGSIKSLCI